MSATVPTLRPANMTAAPGLIPAALSKYTRKLLSGLKSPGDEMYKTTPTTKPSVRSTISPVRTSFRRICIRWGLRDRSFRCSGHKLVDDRIRRDAKPIRRGVFDYLSLVKHSHPSRHL